jgi:hypothetical protein
MVTKKMMKDSLEGQWRKSHIRFFLIGCIVILLLALLFWWVIPNGEGEILATAIVYGPVLLVFSISLLYELIRYYLLFVDSEQYEVYEVSLNRPRISYFYRSRVYFDVLIKTNKEQYYVRKTKPVFSVDYANTKARIAYNEDKDKLIVLGR